MSLSRTLALALVLLSLSAQAFAPALARAEDSFNPGEIEEAMKDFYDHYAGRNTPNAEDSVFLGSDRDRLTRVMARQLITLDPNLFNDVIGHMIAVDYVQSPDNREAIEKLVDAMEVAGKGTVFSTEKGAKQKAAMTVLADTVAVWSIACLSIGVTRSWSMADDEMSGFEKFAFVMKNTPEQMPKSLQSRLALAGMGVAVGSAHAAYDYLYATRFDPRAALERVQDQVVQSLAEKAASGRRILEARIAERASFPVKQLEASEKDLENMENQVLQLSNDDPEYRGRLSPVSEDISVSKGLVEKILSERRQRRMLK